jgi:hypothetical protein
MKTKKPTFAQIEIARMRKRRVDAQVKEARARDENWNLRVRIQRMERERSFDLNTLSAQARDHLKYQMNALINDTARGFVEHRFADVRRLMETDPKLSRFLQETAFDRPPTVQTLRSVHDAKVLEFRIELPPVARSFHVVVDA